MLGQGSSTASASWAAFPACRLHTGFTCHTEGNNTSQMLLWRMSSFCDPVTLCVSSTIDSTPPQRLLLLCAGDFESCCLKTDEVGIIKRHRTTNELCQMIYGERRVGVNNISISMIFPIVLRQRQRRQGWSSSPLCPKRPSMPTLNR
ncbi:hypothetical protein LX36DRAFT_141938 [Colletotrichum falcatum]|nr:hypothetical protein LX36DRAFT_141938 [Colletotrichum falcatum]